MGGQTGSLAFVSGSNSKRRSAVTKYAAVETGQLVLVDDSAAAAVFVLPSFSSGATSSSMSWVPSITDGGFTAGEAYVMYTP